MAILEFLQSNVGLLLTITIGSIIVFVIIFKLLEDTFQKIMMFIMFMILAIVIGFVAYKFFF